MSDAPATTGSIPKPVLRGLHNATIKRNLGAAIGLVFTVSMIFKLTVKDPRKEAYAEFYKTYDAQKAFERMKAAGVFQSC
ncbi:cytochrome c oxidase subunit 6C-like [Episyrphus balteatus]|uniref:cytochrome c oxidase subunit 6C-like n=1 Tax=Episyrphus balteatus TaxID=286459 RepID=UPI0024859561|nr:cytochrome c oxidase subunit 6C-like [Episyrphus balteatus]XP_055854261.1 cytochrome c oxidase subunit 6C-like [Episyrphus balteatus]